MIPSYWPTLYMNASENNTLKDLRNKIAPFLESRVFSKGARNANHPTPTFQLLVLDEADKLTIATQNALRRLIDLNMDHARIIFLCNRRHCITNMLRSRCQVVSFRKIPMVDINNYLTFVLTNELREIHGISSTKDTIHFNSDLSSSIEMSESSSMIMFRHVQCIAEAADGDMRCALQFLSDYLIALKSTPCHAIPIYQLTNQVPPITSPICTLDDLEQFKRKCAKGCQWTQIFYALVEHKKAQLVSNHPNKLPMFLIQAAKVEHILSDKGTVSELLTILALLSY